MDPARGPVGPRTQLLKNTKIDNICKESIKMCYVCKKKTKPKTDKRRKKKKTNETEGYGDKLRTFNKTKVLLLGEQKKRRAMETSSILLICQNVYEICQNVYGICQHVSGICQNVYEILCV